ncbi:MAG: DUF3080 family protein [Candidatus Latescibacterota bacterium]|nr:DUF3080 family protein [Candidatus Latescibacterota bacterium]
MKTPLFIALLFIVGCGEDDASDLLDDYLARVNNATGTPVVDPGSFPTALVPYPRPRDLRLEQQDLRIGLLDLVSLEKCGLAELVAARNSGLGKVITPSQRLLYEHRFLGLARACVNTLATSPDDELQALLEEVVAVKERDITRAFWNATFAGPEFAVLFSLATAPLPLVDGDGTAVEEALSYFVELRPHLGDAALALDSEELEGHFHALQKRRYGGQLLHAMAALTHYLDGAAGALEKRLALKIVCFDGRPTPDARVMHAVFAKFYAGRIQPYLAQVHRQSRTYLTLVDHLTDGKPGVFRASYNAQLGLDNPQGTYSQFARAIQRHTRTWQRLFDQCGFSAAQPSSAR